MGYRRRKSNRVLEQAEVRAAGLAAIDPEMNFGNDRSLSNLNTQINDLQTAINTYNTLMATLDALRSNIKERERNLGDLAEQMLIGVAFQYGKNSPEYETAGGVRKSERIRRSRVSRIKPDNETSMEAL